MNSVQGSGIQKPRAEPPQDKMLFRERSGGAKGNAHPSGRDPGLVGGLSVRARKVDAEHCTHLAVNFRRNAERNNVKNHDHEGGQARSGVNLSKGQFQTTML